MVVLLATTIVSMSMAIKLSGTPAAPVIKRNNPPIVVLMDTDAAHGIYKGDKNAKRLETNADVLNRYLGDIMTAGGLPITLHVETIRYGWNRQSFICKLRPDLVVIHRSAIFHAMNQAFQFEYPPDGEDPSDIWQWLYDVADDNLLLFLAYVAKELPNTKFLVYSRGTGGQWETDLDREQWVHDAVRRFPELKDRITTMKVTGGKTNGNFGIPANRDMIRELVQTILQLPPQKQDRAPTTEPK